MRCLVIEDEADTAKYISNGLRAAGFLATVCRNSISGLRFIMSERWDVVILDRLLPGEVDGLSVLKAFRQLDVVTPVLIVSALGSPSECVRGLRAGGDAYLTKPFAMSELIARLHILIRRSGAWVEEPELHISDLCIDLWCRTATRAGVPIALKPQEFRLLVYLARNKGKVVTRRMLMQSIWGWRVGVLESCVDAHITRFRQKIDKGFFPPLLHTLHGIGYTMGVDA